MSIIKSYRELIVWKKSMILVKEIYTLTKDFPKEELYALTQQMKRAATSIPSNIAEGFGRKSFKEHSQFYLIAFGSGLELETQIQISIDLGFISQSQAQTASGLLDEVLKMLNKMTTTSR